MDKKEYYQKNKAKWKAYYETRRRLYPLYAAWRSMMIRCGHFPGAKPHDVRTYIERGICVWSGWHKYFDFEKWALNNGWEKGLQIDRIDNDKWYEPENCRFVTPERNANNRRNNLFVTYKGKRMVLKDAYVASGCKLNYKTVNGRVRKGWSFERASTVPVCNHMESR